MKILRRIIVFAVCCWFLSAAGADAAGATKRPKFPYPLPSSKKECSSCHVTTDDGKPGALRKQLSSLCLDCHPDRVAPREHRVDIVPALTVKDLPLFQGKMACATCHDPHKNTHGSLLRKPETELCLSCHPL